MELCARAPWVETVEVKRALGNQADDVIPPSRAREAIAKGARRAVERAQAGDLEPYTGEAAPYAIEVELREAISDDMRKNLDALPEFEVSDERCVATVADDMDVGFRRIAYLGYASRPGRPVLSRPSRWRASGR